MENTPPPRVSSRSKSPGLIGLSMFSHQVSGLALNGATEHTHCFLNVALGIFYEKQQEKWATVFTTGS